MNLLNSIIKIVLYNYKLSFNYTHQLLNEFNYIFFNT